MSLKVNDIWIGRLQRVFWFLGWATLALMVFSVATNVYGHFESVQQIEIFPKAQFVFLTELTNIFSGIGEAFFCFLVSSVLGMIFYKKPIQTQQNESFLILTCLGFFGAGLIGLISWIEFGFDIIPSLLNSSGGPAYIIPQIFSYILYFTPHTLSFLYAVTIYVIFKHFAQLVTFESEVV